MGQYYNVTLTKNGKTTIITSSTTARMTEEEKQDKNNWNFYRGAKITEHSWIGNTFVQGIAGKLYNKKGRLAWVGDYTDQIMSEVKSSDGTVAPLPPNELYSGTLYKKNPDGTYYHNENGYIEEDENASLPDGVKVYNRPLRYNPNFDIRDKFIINLSRKEYVDMKAYIKRSTMTDEGWEDWCQHPLPLLTSTGGDLGGGDYHSGCIDAAYVGRWAYDEIIIKDKAPKGKDFKVLNVTFNERKEVPCEGVV